MINTYNESALHHAIKIYYATLFDGVTEVKKYGHIYDVFAGDDHVIEIQNLNLSKLLPKLMDSLQKGLKVTLVHTICVEKTVENYTPEGTLISKRKSPVKGNIYDLFRELTGIYPILFEKNFELHVLEISMSEIRTKTPDGQLVQSQNNRRRFRKDYIKSDKRLNQVIKTHIFKKPEDYTNLIPYSLHEHFCAKDLAAILKKDKATKHNADRNAHLLIWVLYRRNLLDFTGKQNRSNYYKVIKSPDITACKENPASSQ